MTKPKTLTLREKLDDMYEREEWVPEWYAEIAKVIDSIEAHDTLTHCPLCGSKKKKSWIKEL
jgi:hypothetical protein